MMGEDIYPVAMSIAGSDSSGGAGIQADLRAFHFFNVYGATAITALTAQNPFEVSAVEGVKPDMVAQQIRTVGKDMKVGAFKTGMLFSDDIMNAVAREIVQIRNNNPDDTIHLVVDPVMLATSGAKLIDEKAVQTLRELILPLATVITPNIPEAEVLWGKKIESIEDMQEAGLALAQKFKTAVLLKGGHSSDSEAVDILCEDDEIITFSKPRLSDVESSHGSGCSLSAAIAACLARGFDLKESITMAKDYVFDALSNGVRIGDEACGMWPRQFKL